MENIVAAIPGGTPAINGNTSAPPGGGTVSEGLFGTLVANALAGRSQPGSKGAKASGQGDGPSALLLAALMQYGSLFGMLPAQAGAAQADSAQQSASSGTAPLQQLSPQQSGQAGQMSLMAVRLLMDMGQAAQAGQTGAASGTGNGADTAQAQGSQEFLALLEALGSEIAQAQGTDPAAVSASGASAQQGQSGAAALQEIRELFISLVESGQGAGKDAQGSAPSSAEPADTGAAQALQALLDAIGPPAQDAAHGGTQAETSSGNEGRGLDLAKLPDRAGGAGATAGEKKETVSFDNALRALGGQAQHAEATGVQGGKTASAHAGASAAEAFDKIVDKISAMQNSAQKEMEISLKPDYLGKIVIKLSMGDDGGLVAKIAASNPKVQDAFANQASTLQSALTEQGLKDVRVVVTSTSVPDAALQQQTENRGQSRREQEKRRNPAVVDATGGVQAMSQPLLAYEQAYRTGSVNRLA